MLKMAFSLTLVINMNGFKDDIRQFIDSKRYAAIKSFRWRNCQLNVTYFMFFQCVPCINCIQELCPFWGRRHR